MFFSASHKLLVALLACSVSTIASAGYFVSARGSTEVRTLPNVNAKACASNEPAKRCDSDAVLLPGYSVSVDTGLQVFPYPSSPAGFARGSATADLTTGALSAKSLATSKDYTVGRAEAHFGDRLFFDVAGAGPTTRTTIRLRYELEGSGLGVLNMSASSYDGYTAHESLVGTYGPKRDRTGYEFSGISGDWIVTGDPAFDGSTFLIGQIDLIGSAPFLDLDLQLVVFETSDFSHTGRFAFDFLPAGVTWRSDSGVFLSAVPNATIDEPGTGALMSAALLIAGRARGRIRRSLCDVAGRIRLVSRRAGVQPRDTSSS